jgi:Uma2 family endonuclease
MTYAFTYDQVAKMLELNIIPEGTRVELIEGALIEMPSEGPLHVSQAAHVAKLLQSLYPSAWVRVDSPLLVNAITAPEPDIAIVRGTETDYLGAHPNGMDAILVVELAVTSLKRDRNKAARYARGAVQAYWILDVPKKQLEIFAEPNTLAERYAQTMKLTKDEHAVLPEIWHSIRVGDLFL